MGVAFKDLSIEFSSARGGDTMAELKTKPNDRSVKEFLSSVDDEQKRDDSFTLLELMQTATKAEPMMWGDSIVGFGDRHYTYASGREGDLFVIGFSPRKQNLTIYLTDYVDGYDAILQSLGKYTTGKGCLYIKRLDDIHMPTLKKLIAAAVKKGTAA